MSAFIKSLDAQHMVSVGSEGFFGMSTPERLKHNPDSGAQRMGVDFVRNMAPSSVDFATVHMWVDEWLFCGEECKLDFAKGWVFSHLAASEMDAEDPKPVVLEEFGKWQPIQTRDALFNQV